MNSQLNIALDRYEVALKCFLDKSNFDLKQVLAVLNARDQLQKALEDEKTHIQQVI